MEFLEKGRFPIRGQYRGTFVSDAQTKAIELSNDKGAWVGTLELDSRYLGGSLKFKDFLLQPVDPLAPPYTQVMAVDCSE